MTTRRSIRRCGWASLALIGLAIASLPGGAAGAAVSRTLNGRVTCDNGQAVTGIWVDVGSGQDAWAAKYVMKNQPSTALFSVVLSAASSTDVRLSVGCGGSAAAWASTNKTPARSFTRDETFNAGCNGAGACAWTTPGPEWPPLRVSAMLNCGDGTCNGYHPYAALDLVIDHQWVHASGPGVVHEVGINPNDARGKFVAIRHPDGRYSRYLHLAEVGITVGTRVIAGTKVGISGDTGDAEGAHLHYDEQMPYGTRSNIGPIYSFGTKFSTTNPDRSGYLYPNICRPGVTAWRQVLPNTCAVLVNEGR